jgi:cellulose synthase (UDP-forming)
VGYFDFSVVRPHLVIALLLAAGVIAGIVRALRMTTLAWIRALSPLTSVGDLQPDLPAGRDCRCARNPADAQNDSYRCEIPVLIHYASGVVTRSHTADLSMGGCRIVAPDDRHLDDEIEEIELLLQSGAISFR